MKNSARTRSPRLPAALLPLLFLPVPALLAQDGPATVVVPGDVRDLLRDAQAACLPSASSVTQDVGAVSVAPADADAAAWFAAVGSGAALAFEDPATDETVVTNPVTGGAARVAPEDGYDPIDFFLAAGYNVETNADLLPFYDPCLVTVSLSLVPSNTVGEAANAPSPTNSLSSGWLASFHKTESALSTLPDFAALPVDLWLSVPAIDFPSTTAAWTGTDSRFRDYFAARFSGSLWIETPGEYVFHLASDDGAALWIDGATAILDDGSHSFRTRSVAVELAAGLHDVVVGYYENANSAGLRLSWTPPGGVEAVVPASAVFHDEPASYAPGVRLAAPDPAVCYVGNEVALSATAWGFGEAVARVDFFADGALVSSVSNAPFAAAWETAATGTVAVSAVATDSAGAVSVPSVRAVEVLSCPPGYAAGLSSTYYAISSRPGDLPDFSLLTPCQTRIEHSINHTEATAWPGVPVSATRLFASRHAGRLFVPATGDWTLMLESAEGSRLYLDGALVVDNGGAHTRRTRSGTVRLTYGFHDFEILHFTQGAPPTLRLHWQSRDAAWTTIPQTRYFRVVGETDSDDDGIEDWWEIEFGFDPSDPSDAALDPDSDGLSNLAEFLVGTNPLLADSDGDGMRDGWELANGLDASTDDAALDADGDGVTNLEEYRAGTNPNVRDSDGDGLSDYDELHGLGTDPAVFDFEADWRAYATLPAAQTVDRADVWSPKGDSLLSWRRGHVDWLFTTTNAAKGFLRVSASHFRHTVASTAPLSARSRFYAYSGDDLLGVAFLDHAPGAEPAIIRFPLPFLPAGPHRIRLVWDGIDPALGVCLHEAALETPGGPDENGDGLEDWVLAQSFARDSVPASVSTVFSPACLEGSALAPTRVSLSFGTNALAATATGPSSWYADVPLAPGANPVSVSFEGGLRTAAASVSWVPFDVSSAATSLVARLGDTILLSSPDAATVYVTANGLGRGALSLAAGVPVQLLFDDSGLWRLVVSRPGASAVVHEVRILGGGFPDEDPALLLGCKRSWTYPDLPAAAVLSTDGSLWLSRTSGANLQLRTDTLRVPHRLVARVAEGGAILDVARFRVFWLRAVPDGYLHPVEKGEGCEVWIDDLETFGVPDDVEIRVAVVIAGSTFEDFTLSRTRPGSGFSPASRWPLRFLHPDGSSASVCHTIQAFQGGVLLGDAHGDSTTTPQEMN